MRSLMYTAVSLILVGLCPQFVAGNPYPKLIQQLGTVNYRSWQITASYTTAAAYDAYNRNRVRTGGGSRAMAEARQKALQEYLAKLTDAMQPSAKVAHIPREHPIAVDENQKWTKYYTLAKNSMRPRVEYEWTSNATGKADTLLLTEEYIDVWQANFDVFMWYRDQLEQKSADDSHIGGKKFKLFLDHIVAGLLDGLPSAPEIDMNTGTVSTPAWELDERRLRKQLVFAYRYLLAKYQIYPEYDEFAPADIELFSSLAKLAILMGAQLDDAWFSELDVELIKVGTREKWKRPAREALQILQADAQAGSLAEEQTGKSDYRHDEPCIITIPPPQPKPSKAPNVPNGSPVPKVEIIVRPGE